MIYDHFSPAIVFCLEGFGFCPVGEGLDFVQRGHISIGGELPVNPNGGHLSESYMQGWAFQVEAVRQLRGECGERQIKDCRTIQYAVIPDIITGHIYRR